MKSLGKTRQYQFKIWHKFEKQPNNQGFCWYGEVEGYKNGELKETWNFICDLFQNKSGLLCYQIKFKKEWSQEWLIKEISATHRNLRNLLKKIKIWFIVQISKDTKSK